MFGSCFVFRKGSRLITLTLGDSVFTYNLCYIKQHTRRTQNTYLPILFHILPEPCIMRMRMLVRGIMINDSILITIYIVAYCSTIFNKQQHALVCHTPFFSTTCQIFAQSKSSFVDHKLLLGRDLFENWMNISATNKSDEGHCIPILEILVPRVCYPIFNTYIVIHTIYYY